MAIDGLGSNSPLTPPLDLNTPPADKGTLQTGGTNSAGNVGGTAPTGNTTSPIAPNINVLSPAVSAPKPNSTPLDRPKLVLPSQTTSLSVGDLIILIQQEIQKTSESLAQAQNAQVKQDGLRQQAANKSQIEALNKAAEQILEIQKQQKDMEIANWCMTAFSIFMTVCTAGSLGVLFGPLMVAGTVATQVPIEGKNFSGWLTEGVGKGVGEMQKAILKEAVKNKIGREPTKEELTKAYEDIENNQDYYAMAIMITLEVAIAVVITVCSLGSAGPEAASGGAAAVAETSTASAMNIATKAAETAMKEATEVATKVAETTIQQTTKAVEKAAEISIKEATNITEKVVEQSVKQAADVTEKVAQAAAKTATRAAESSTSTLNKAQKAFDVAQTVGNTAKDLALDGANIHTAVLQEQNTETMANADKLKAYVKFLQQILKSDQEFLKELIDMQANIAETTRGILQTEHSTNMHIANLTTHA